MPTDPALLALLRDLRQRLGDLYGDRLVRAVLYGSHARGDAAPDSDVDVLVVLRGEVNVMREDRRASEVSYDLWEQTGTDVHLLPLPESRFGAELDPLVMNVRAEGTDLSALA